VMQHVTAEEKTLFQNLDMPFLCIQDSLPGTGDGDFFKLGQRAAEALNLAVVTGEVKLNVANLDSACDTDSMALPKHEMS